jgi:hypothetical protein
MCFTESELPGLSPKLPAYDTWCMPRSSKYSPKISPQPVRRPSETLGGLVLQPRKAGRTCFGLPITFETHEGPTAVLACPDTGSDLNIISEGLAQFLGLPYCDDAAPPGHLVVADGRRVRPIGRVVADLRLGSEASVSLSILTCTFEVLRRVPSHIIMGMGFLEQTKVMSMQRHLLIKLQRDTHQMPTVASVGRPRQSLLCELNHEATAVTPDSGSQVDLMSPSFAFDRQFELHPTEQHIELADGEIAICRAFVRTTLSIGTHLNDEGYPSGKAVAAIDFFLLEGLTHDVIVGEHHLDELRIFTDNQHALVLGSDMNAAWELNRIRSKRSSVSTGLHQLLVSTLTYFTCYNL